MSEQAEDAESVQLIKSTKIDPSAAAALESAVPLSVEQTQSVASDIQPWFSDYEAKLLSQYATKGGPEIVNGCKSYIAEFNALDDSAKLEKLQADTANNKNLTDGNPFFLGSLKSSYGYVYERARLQIVRLYKQSVRQELYKSIGLLVETKPVQSAIMDDTTELDELATNKDVSNLTKMMNYVKRTAFDNRGKTCVDSMFYETYATDENGKLSTFQTVRKGIASAISTLTVSSKMINYVIKQLHSNELQWASNAYKYKHEMDIIDQSNVEEVERLTNNLAVSMKCLKRMISIQNFWEILIYLYNCGVSATDASRVSSGVSNTMTNMYNAFTRKTVGGKTKKNKRSTRGRKVSKSSTRRRHNKLVRGGDASIVAILPLLSVIALAGMYFIDGSARSSLR